jgi:hypothetical protein
MCGFHRHGISYRVPERPERGSELDGEELRLLPRGEVSAPVDVVEVDEVAIGAPGPAADRLLIVGNCSEHRVTVPGATVLRQAGAARFASLLDERELDATDELAVEPYAFLALRPLAAAEDRGRTTSPGAAAPRQPPEAHQDERSRRP